MCLNRKNDLLVILCAAFLLASCSSRYRNALFTNPSDLVTDTIKTVYVVNSDQEASGYYKIKTNDILSIRNLQDVRYISATESQNSVSQLTNFRVEDDGNVTLPVIGKVEVSGLSRKEAALKIEDIYEQRLLKDPIIELTIINLKVTLLGEFMKQGNYLLEKENTTLIDIIGEAGGISPKADPKTLKIIRGNRQNPQIIYVNLKDINSLARPELILKNNDIIYIEPQGIYNTQERVQSLSSVLQPVLIILNTALVIYSISR